METLIWPEKPSLSSRSPASQNRVIGELIHGRDLALQLQTLLHRGSRNNGSLSVREMAGEILRTFTESISALSSSSVEFGEVCDDGGSEDSISSKKRASSKDGRGCYKRRKGSETWSTVARTVEDAHSWRKYGQKVILNAKFPRCYFRCSHKLDQGCRATKQVQQREDNDQKMYHITYIGHHTCKKTLKSPQIIPDSGSDPWESYSAITCEPKPLQNNQENNLFAFGSVKQEPKKEDAASDMFGPMMFGEADVVVGSGGHEGMDNSLDDMNDFLINLVGFDDHDFGFPYNNDLL